MWNNSSFAEEIAERFHEAHEMRYGHCNREEAVEFVAVRLAALGDLGRVRPRPALADSSKARTWPGMERNVIFDRENHETDVVRREQLPFFAEIHGPAIVEEPTATTIVPPGWRLRVDAFGSLIMTAEENDSR